MHRFNPSPWEEKAGRPLGVWGYPGLQDSLSYREKLSQKSKQKQKMPQVNMTLVSLKCPLSTISDLQLQMLVFCSPGRNVNSAERKGFHFPSGQQFSNGGLKTPSPFRELGAQPQKLLLSRLHSLMLVIWKIKAVHFKITSLTYFRKNKFWKKSSVIQCCNHFTSGLTEAS